MGFTATAALVATAAASTYAQLSGPKAPSVAPPPQAAKVPDAMGTRNALAGTGQGGGSPGIANTFLTGSQGVDPSLLNLGKNTLLGGGTSSGLSGMASGG